MAPIILLTGATGLIGFRVLLTILAAGHTVRCAVRSEAKVKRLSSNPAIEKLSPGERLSFIIVPNICADGAYDAALKGVSHVIHVGAPVPVPGKDPETEIYEPILKCIQGLLMSALHTPTVQRVVITSSIVANLPPAPPFTSVTDTASGPATAASRIQLNIVSPPKFTNVFEAYHIGKINALNAADAFSRLYSPHFSIAHVVPGYVFGRNELATNATMLCTESSSDNLLLAALTGTVLPAPIHGSAAHIDDVAYVHLRALLLEPSASSSGSSFSPKQDFGVSIPVVYDDAFDYVAAHFPKAVSDGVFSRGQLPTLPVAWDSSETETALEIKFRSFESAVVDLAGQYLDLLGKEKA